jgi:hypothetical protein
MAFGRSIELYLVDGRPDGLLTARVFNWTGQVLKAPRLRIKEALARPEADFTGVYLLIGEREGLPLAYIGEGEEIASRIRSHDVQRDWWTDALLISTSANELNKAHVKYLESRMVEQARAAAVMTLENGTQPARPGLSEAARANMEEFLDTLYMVLPTLGVTLFTSQKRPAASSMSLPNSKLETRFRIDAAKFGISATAILLDSEFVVEAGSVIRLWVGQGEHSFGYRDLQSRLVSSGVVVVDGNIARFAANYAFNSPSAAAAVVLGRPANGRTEWKHVGTGATLHAWDAAELAP